MLVRSIVQPIVSGVGAIINVLPTENLLAYYEMVDGSVVDTVGLSVADYALVDETVRDIFFVDSSTLRDTEDAYELARLSEYLNLDTMIGGNGMLILGEVGTSRYILNKWLVYVGEPEVAQTIYGKYYNSDHYINTENYT